MSSTGPRFDLYIKAARDGHGVGDCPFSHRATMFMKLKLDDARYTIKPVSMTSKPQWFLDMNPTGGVPVLVDHDADNKVIADSAEITKYMESVIPEPCCSTDYNGQAQDACMGVFGKFAAFMKNKENAKTDELKLALVQELKKMNDYLDSSEQQGGFLLGDVLSELDCMILPRLKHILVAGKHYLNFDIPEEFTALTKYIEHGQQCDVFAKTCCANEEILHGWSKYFI